MKKFFENFDTETVKEFLANHFERIWFVIVMAIFTIMMILTNNGYGNVFQASTAGGGYSPKYYYHSDESERQLKRQPWKMQKPSSGSAPKSAPKSASKSSSSGHR